MLISLSYRRFIFIQHKRCTSHTSMGVGAEVGDPVVGAGVGADFDLLQPLAGDNIYDIDPSDSSPLIVLR